MYPSIDLSSALALVGDATYRRGVAYAREGRVLRCQLDPDVYNLVGKVSGSQGRTYATTVQLLPADIYTWSVERGVCSCPVHAGCKHVAAVVVAAAGTTKMGPDQRRLRRLNRRGSSRWMRCFPRPRPTIAPDTAGDRAEPVGERAVADSRRPARATRKARRLGGRRPELGNLHMLRHCGHPDAQLRLLQKLYATFQTSSSNSIGYYRYSYGGYTYGNMKTISLLQFESPQLWPLLDEARRVGVQW